jgi:hypothetical protein
MNIEERKQMATHYYTRGSKLISSSKKLWESNDIYGFDLLLYVGIELVLKSYLVIKDTNITINKLQNYYGHNINSLLRDAGDYDDLNAISNNDIKNIIDWLLESYSPNIVDLRYNVKDKLRVFPVSIYDTLESWLVAPMLYILKQFKNNN